jgi:hypothetical protein
MIMLLSRWSSNAFMHFIHKQFKEFSTGVSEKMITNEHFFTIPKASRDGPRILNCEDIQVMWEDVTGFGTSFPNSYQAYY